MKSESEDENRVFSFSFVCSMKSWNYLIFFEIVLYGGIKLCFVVKIVQMTNNTHTTDIVLCLYFLFPTFPYTIPFKEKRTERCVTCIFGSSRMLIWQVQFSTTKITIIQAEYKLRNECSVKVFNKEYISLWVYYLLIAFLVLCILPSHFYRS